MSPPRRGSPAALEPAAATAGASSSGIAASATEQTRRNLIGPLVLGSVVLALILFGVLTTDAFVTKDNIINVLQAASITGIAALGMTFITASGSFFSLSVQQTAAIAAILFAFAIRDGWPPVLAIVAVLAAAAVIGLLQGGVVAAGANPIITTLGAGAALFGLAAALTGNRTIRLETDAVSWIGQGRPLGIPTQVIFFVVLTVIAALILSKTRTGRETLLVGANRDAAYSTGLRVARTVTLAFVLTGLAAGICGILVASQIEQGIVNQFPDLNIDVIAAVLVAGTAVQGGDASMWRTALGACFIALLQNLMLLRDYPFGVRTLVVGLAVLVGVTIYTQFRRRMQ
jgi:ribose transport system permease protein